jgi:hypothetical protein
MTNFQSNLDELRKIIMEKPSACGRTSPGLLNPIQSKWQILNCKLMVPAQQISYDDAGNKLEQDIEVFDAIDAWQLAHNFWQKSKEAYCISRNEFGKEIFCVRVMTKEKVIFKIQSIKYVQEHN